MAVYVYRDSYCGGCDHAVETAVSRIPDTIELLGI